MIQIEQLHKRFGDRVAVAEVSFCARLGEVLGLLGPNGAGKTTTLRMLTGFLRPDRGAVKIFDYDLWRQPEQAKALLGYLPEGAPAYGEMTPRGFLDFIARVRGLRGSDKSHRLRQVVTELELQSVLDRPIERLSKGFKRRVGLAQAILHRPPALILDEPTDGLDPIQRQQVRKLIRTLAQTSLVILSTHLLEEIESVCDRVVILAAGRVVADTTPQALTAQAPLEEAFLRLVGTAV